MSGLTDWFWDERVWLPPNMTWENVRPVPGSQRFVDILTLFIIELSDFRYTKFEELWYPIPAGILLIFVRGYVMRWVTHYCTRPGQDISTRKHVSYRSWFKPLGLYLGIKNSSRQKPATNEVLELEFSKMSQTNQQAQSTSVPLPELSSQLGMTERQIEIWLKRRKMFGI